MLDIFIQVLIIGGGACMCVFSHGNEDDSFCSGFVSGIITFGLMLFIIQILDYLLFAPKLLKP